MRDVLSGDKTKYYVGCVLLLLILDERVVECCHIIMKNLEGSLPNSPFLKKLKLQFKDFLVNPKQKLYEILDIPIVESYTGPKSGWITKSKLEKVVGKDGKITYKHGGSILVKDTPKNIKRRQLRNKSWDKEADKWGCDPEVLNRQFTI